MNATTRRRGHISIAIKKCVEICPLRKSIIRESSCGGKNQFLSSVVRISYDECNDRIELEVECRISGDPPHASIDSPEMLRE